MINADICASSSARIEFRVFLATYILTLILQILTLGAYFEQVCWLFIGASYRLHTNRFVLLSLCVQFFLSSFVQGSAHLAALTAIHAGSVAALFWFLVANAIVSTQIIEDGTPASVIVSGLKGCGVGTHTDF